MAKLNGVAVRIFPAFLLRLSYRPSSSRSHTNLLLSDAEYCLLQASAAVRIPSHIPASQYAPILCAGLSSFNSLRHMNVSPGSTVAIQGVGGLGHLAIQYASKSGYRVVAISRGSSKEKIARELGAHEYIDASNGDVSEALQKFGGASLVVVTANSPETINPLITGLGVLGKVLFLAGTSSSSSSSSSSSFSVLYNPNKTPQSPAKSK